MLLFLPKAEVSQIITLKCDTFPTHVDELPYKQIK